MAVVFSNYMDDGCPFCALPKERIWMETEDAIALFDNFPITEGHSLVIPKTHVPSLFSVSPDKQLKLWRFVAEVRSALASKYHPDGFNIGLNDGAAAGQTIGHAHIHIIPRRKSDVADPRGGVRWIIPDKADYWSK